jgi:hypothetical protein
LGQTAYATAGNRLCADQFAVMADDLDTLFPPPPGYNEARAAEAQKAEAANGQLPSVDDLFPAETERQAQSGIVHSPVQDFLFSDAAHRPAAHVLDAFGEGFQEQWGQRQIGLSKDSQDKLEKAGGTINDYLENQGPIVKAVNQTLIRPAATELAKTLESTATEWHMLGGALGGVLRGGQAAVAQIGEEVGAPKLGREIAAIPEAFPSGFHGTVGPAPGFLESARALRVIGSDHLGWTGKAAVEAVKEAEKPLMPEAPISAVQEAQTAQPQMQPPVGETIAAAQPNVTAAARASAPQVFEQYDALNGEAAALRSVLSQQDEEAAGGMHQPSVPSDVAQTRLLELNQEIEALAPQVRQAYQDAAVEAGGAQIITPRFPTMAHAVAAQGEGIGPGTGEVVPLRPIEAQRAAIAQDVTTQLVAAGRPAEEARLAGNLYAARYEAMAAHFGGALGTAEDLYREIAPTFTGEARARRLRAVETQPAAEAKEAGPAKAGAPAAEGAQGEAAVSAEGAPSARVAGAQGAASEIDATHDVVTGANSGKASGKVYIDRHIPELSPTLKDAEGNPVNLWNLLALHERIEADTMRAGVPYQQAHLRATDAERTLATRTGINFNDYTHEVDGYLAQIEHEASHNAPKEELHVDPAEALDKHTSAAKQAPQVATPTARAEAFAPLVAQYEKSGMVENAEAYRDAAKKRHDKYGGGTIQVYKSAHAEAEAHGMSVGQVNAERAALEEEYGPKLDAALAQHDMRPGDLSPSERSAVLDLMVNRGYDDPMDALEVVLAKQLAEGREIEHLDALDAAEGIVRTEEGHGDLHDEIPFDREPGVGGEGAEREGGQAQGTAAAGEGARETSSPQQIFQRFVDARAERRAPGIPGSHNLETTRIGTPLHKARVQEWTPGNVVDAGFVKNLLIVGREADGDFKLLAKPDAEGVSKSYSAKPHGGLTAGDPVDFLDATEALRAEREYFQRRRATGPDLFAEREAEGQQQIPGADRITQAELVQRRANEPLKPSVEQKPMDVGLFGDEKDQRELFQGRQGSATFRPGEKPIVRLLSGKADASTIIHESGHVFLEEMKTFAGHPAAPDIMKADWETTQDWLGVKAGEELTVRQHEKFARGFEQYLREGVAPSPELANVFARFRDWLVRIYESLRGLGQEISPSMREVYDRLLAQKPERTVIAPELAKAPDLADIHAADADLTPPHFAEGAADRIVNEVTKEHAGLPANEADEHARVAAEIGSRPSEPATLESGSGTPESLPTGTAISDATSAELPRGGESLPEGAALEQEPSPALARSFLGGKHAGEIKPLPVGPHLPFDELPTAEMDKVGNIRLENLNTPADVNDAIRELYRSNQDRLDRATRRVVTDQQVMDLADSMGSDPRLVANNMERLRAMTVEDGVPLAARIWLLRDMFTKLGTQVRQAIESGSEATYAEARQRFLMAHETLSGVTAEMGRGLRAFRNMKGSDETALAQMLQENTGKTLFQIRQEMALGRAADTPAKIARMVQDAESTPWEKVRVGALSYVYNNLLSGPLTHLAYLVGVQVPALLRATVTTPMAALAGNVMEAFGKDIPAAQRVTMAEVLPQLHGLVHGMMDGWYAARQALATGTTIMKGDPSGVDLFANDALYRPQAIPGRIGYVIETPSRMVAAIHSFNYASLFEGQMASMSVRDALGAGLNPGSAAFDTHVAAFRNNPPAAAMEGAHNIVMEQMMMKRPTFGTTQYAIQKAINSNFAAKLVFPFVQLGVNLEKLALEQTPLWWGKTARDDFAGRNGAAAQQMRVGQVTVGTGLALGTLGMAMDGLITGGGPSDAKERQVLEMTGWKPYSVKVGNLYVPYRKWMAYLGPLVAGAVDLHEIGHLMTEGKMKEAAKSLSFGFSEVVADETWMRGLFGLTQLARGDVSVEKFIRNQTMEFLPMSVGLGQLSSMADPVWRDVRSEMDALRAHVPWMHSSLHPMRDVWGQPMAGGSQIFWGHANNDPATNALIKAELWPARMGRSVKKVPLTDQQYDDMTRIAGTDAKLRVNALVANPGWQRVPPDVQKEMLRKAINGSRSRAETIMMMQNPDIIRQATQAKMQQLHQQTVH